MEYPYWRKQSMSDPLFPDILWSRPETRLGAGKLTIIGGNAHEIRAPGIAYSAAIQAGIGVCKVVMPDATKKIIGSVFPDAEFAPSTPSGSFSKKALTDLYQISTWSDGVLLAGSFGRNSETATLLEQYVREYSGILTVTEDAVDYFKLTPRLLLERPNTLVVVSLAQLQKIFIHIPVITPIIFSMSLVQLVEALHTLTDTFPAIIAVVHAGQLCLAYRGHVITMPFTKDIWRVETAAWSCVYWIQNPSKPLESISSSIVTFNN